MRDMVSKLQGANRAGTVSFQLGLNSIEHSLKYWARKQVTFSQLKQLLPLGSPVPTEILDV